MNMDHGSQPPELVWYQLARPSQHELELCRLWLIAPCHVWRRSVKYLKTDDIEGRGQEMEGGQKCMIPARTKSRLKLSDEHQA